MILQVKVESYSEPYFKSYLNPIILACKKLANDLWADQESRNTFAFRVPAHKSRYQPNHPIIKIFDNWPVPTRLRGCLWRTSESDSESKRSPLWQLTAIKSRKILKGQLKGEFRPGITIFGVSGAAIDKHVPGVFWTAWTWRRATKYSRSLYHSNTR